MLVLMLQVVFDETEGEAGEWSWCGESGGGRIGLHLLSEIASLKERFKAFL